MASRINPMFRFGTLLYVRGNEFFNSASLRTRLAVGGFLSKAMSSREISELGIWLYDRAPRLFLGGELWPWEREWLEEDLPPPPARILIGAAGSGREAIVLAKAGYHIDAFDPAPQMAALCRQDLVDPHRSLVGTYEDLIDCVLDGATNELSAFANTTYDAVLLGWGSLSNVISAPARCRLLETACGLAPQGPVLASFFLGETPVSRSRDVGEALGRPLGRMRGIDAADDELEFSTELGFLHHFQSEEITELAATVGREARFGARPGFPHVTFAAPRPTVEVE